MAPFRPCRVINRLPVVSDNQWNGSIPPLATPMVLGIPFITVCGINQSGGGEVYKPITGWVLTAQSERRRQDIQSIITFKPIRAGVLANKHENSNLIFFTLHSTIRKARVFSLFLYKITQEKNVRVIGRRFKQIGCALSVAFFRKWYINYSLVYFHQSLVILQEPSEIFSRSCIHIFPDAGVINFVVHAIRIRQETPSSS